ncbi:MAG TPA: hypothetical protein VES62_17800 [Thermoleophilaceae bacterium]|nr:hypothetical protein [Thermoleophilaceae bacterium]
MTPSTGATGTPFWRWLTTRWRSNRGWSPWRAAITGTKGCAGGGTTSLGTFPDYTLDIEELRDLGDVTLGDIRGSGHGSDSAAPLVDPFWHPVRWRDGKIVWWRNCSTEAEALEAVGLRN